MSTLPTNVMPKQPVRLSEVKTYLQVKGWHLRSYDNPRLQVYQGQLADDGKPIEVVLTQNDSYIDTSRRISEVISTLAGLEDRPEEQVIQDVASVDDDITLWRIPKPDDEQFISVELAASFINGLQFLLTYSACLEETPRPYFPRATAIGREFVQHCRLGHTRPGSFIFEMEAPLSSEIPRASAGSNGIPFSRRVMQRLMRGLLAVHEASMLRDDRALVESYRDGLNANAYETLAFMLDTLGEGGLEFEFKWSPVLVNPSDNDKSGFTALNRDAVKYLRNAAQQLRAMKPQSGIRLRGRLLRLGADTDGTPRVITLETNIDGTLRHVRVSLEPDYYSKACDAHRDGRTVQVTGDLEKVGRGWRLLEPHDFSIA